MFDEKHNKRGICILLQAPPAGLNDSPYYKMCFNINGRRTVLGQLKYSCNIKCLLVVLFRCFIRFAL